MLKMKSHQVTSYINLRWYFVSWRRRRQPYLCKFLRGNKTLPCGRWCLVSSNWGVRFFRCLFSLRRPLQLQPFYVDPDSSFVIIVRLMGRVKSTRLRLIGGCAVRDSLNMFSACGGWCSFLIQRVGYQFLINVNVVMCIVPMCFLIRFTNVTHTYS